MKKRRRRNRRENSEQMRVIRLWSQTDAKQAFPYIRSIANGMREHWLAAAGNDLRIKRLSAMTGRPSRDTLVAIEDARSDRERSFNRFEEALDELNRLDVFCVDPVKGTVWLPFRSGDDLAWYIFDAFDRKGLVGWRLHTDTMETVRPLAEILPRPETPPGPLTV